MFIMRNKIDMNKIGGINMKQRVRNKTLAVIVSLCMAVLILPFSVFAGTGTTDTCAFNVAGGTYGTDYTYSETLDDTTNVMDKVLTVLTNTPLTITADSTVTDARIEVAENVKNANITISELKLELNEFNGSPLTVKSGSTLTLTISGKNTLDGYAAGPGILVENGAELTINGTEKDVLDVFGAQMQLYSDQGGTSGGQSVGFAGIGGPNSSDAYTYTGKITINGGTVNAHGYGYGAGIGGGDYGSGGTITINGGVVTATTGEGLPGGWIDSTKANASGIGASQGQPGGVITITGGTVAAYGGYGSAGIGGGTADVTITGGSVTAYGGPLAAGIGGYNQNKGDIKITIGKNATVTAYSGNSASAIGQGSDTSAPVTLRIENGAKVYAFSKEGFNRPAITQVANSADDPANMINAYITNMTLPLDVPIVAELDGDKVNLTVPKGSGGVAFTTGAAGEYTAKTAAEVPPQNIVYQFILEDNSKATVTSGTEFGMEKVKAVEAGDFTKEPAPEAKADYENNRLTGLVAGANYRLEAGEYSLEATADENGYITHKDFPAFYGLQISIIKLGDGVSTLDSDPQILQTIKPEVTALEIKTKPAKTEYTIGEATDWTGLEVTLTYSADTQTYKKDVVLADFESYGITLSEANGTALDTAETKTITVSCNNIDVTFDITVGKKQQTLAIEAVGEKTYGDAAFSLNVTGGEGSGALSYEVTSGDSVKVDENGLVTVVKTGESVITVKKAADDIYNETSATITITVKQAVPVLETRPTLSGRVRRGRLLSTVSFSGGRVNGVTGEALEGSWSWKNDRVMETTGTFKETAVFTPKDKNYESIEIVLNVEVYSSSGTKSDYILNFDTRGGSKIDSVEKTYASTVDLTKYVPTRSGYEFDGWYADKNLTNKITSIRLSGNDTVYAGWTEKAPEPDDEDETDEDEDDTQNETEFPFKDVNESDWFREAVEFVYEKGLFSGVTEEYFAPEESITRGMLVTVLWRMESKPVVNYLMRYEDVDQSAYYAEAIRWAASEGIVNGYSETEFAPDKEITREEFAAIINRYADYIGEGDGNKASITGFADSNEVSNWAYENMRWAVGTGLINGTDGNRLDPQGITTRAEAAAILQRFLEK